MTASNAVAIPLALAPGEIVPARVMTLPVKHDPTNCFPGHNVAILAGNGRIQIEELKHYPDRKLAVHDGLVVFVIRDKSGFCDAEGKIQIEPAYDAADDFEEQRAVVVVHGKYGYIDPAGVLVVEPKFDNALSFRKGLGCVKQGERWGVMGPDGAWIKKPFYTRIDLLVGGLRAQSADGKEGWINSQGELDPHPTR